MGNECNNKREGRTLLLKAFGRQAVRKLEQGSTKTAKNYRTTIAKLQTFMQNKEESPPVRLCDIDNEWVQRFNDWLNTLHPEAPGTVGFYIRNFKAMYNRAVRQEEVTFPESGYPFGQTSVREAPPFKRALPRETVQHLGDKSLYEQLTPVHRQSLDLFLFMFFSQGINFQDLYSLTYEQEGLPGYIIYVRSKTGVQLKVKLSAEMKTILCRHRSPDSPWLFPFLHERRRNSRTGKPLDADSALKRTNRHLKHIGRKIGIDISLTTYVSRHTFATLMLESGAAVELISQLLGHTSIRTTQIYLSKLSTRKIDQATEKMLDLYVRPTPRQAEKNAAPTTDETQSKTKKKRPSLRKKRTLAKRIIIVQWAKLQKLLNIGYLRGVFFSLYFLFFL